MIRPTPRAVGLFSVGIPVAFLMVVYNRSLWIVAIAWSLLALVVIGADALMILRRRLVEITVREPARLPVGDSGAVRIALSMPERTRPTPITLVLEQSGIADLPVRVAATSRSGRLAVDLAVRSERRGTIGLDALWLRWRGPPRRLAHPRGPPRPPPHHRVGVQQQKGEGAEFETLREHVAGLDNRHIDWKRSARHNKLLSKVFRTERNHQVVLAFDTGHLMLEPIEGKARLDHAIEAGLLLGWISLRAGDLVGDFAFDATVRQFIAPAAGLPYLSKLQQGAARLAYSTQETNFTLGLAALNQRLKRRALVVLFTECVDTVTAQLLVESLARIANRHAVIFVTLQDPAMTRLMRAEPTGFEPVAQAVIAHDFLRERAIVLERIARMGVHVLDVPVRGLSSGLVNRYLLVKQRGQI